MVNLADNCGIIVLGLPRSGTTLLRRILNAHPRIACGGETFLLRATAQFFESDTITNGIDYGVAGGLNAAGFSEQEIRKRVRQLAFSFLDEIAVRQGKPRWATKTAVDSFYVSEIEKLYGGHAQFICVIRHGLDTAMSLRELCEANEVYIKELHEYIKRFRRPLHAFVQAWKVVTSQLLDFSDRNRENTLLVRYEDLVDDPVACCDDIFAFLGEDRDSEILQRAMSDDDVQGLGDWKTYDRKTINSESVGRWKSLRPDIVSRLGPMINPLLAECAYEPVPVKSLPNYDQAMHQYEVSMRFNLARSKDDKSGN